MQDWREEPPPARRITDVVVERFPHVLEVDPALMQDSVLQHDMPVWDTRRIVDARTDYLAWMHRHWAEAYVSFDAHPHGEGGGDVSGEPGMR